MAAILKSKMAADKHKSQPGKLLIMILEIRRNILMSIVAKRLNGSRWHLHRGGLWSRLHCTRLGPSSPPQKGGGAPSQFSAHVGRGQTAGWIKMALGREVDLGPCDIVLDGDPAAPKKGSQHPSPISAHVYCGQTVAHLSYC